MINTMTTRTIILLFTLLASLTACGQFNDIPLGEYRIEWDDHDPKLHGQEFYFTEPMAYAVLEDKHLELGWVKEDIAIGRYIDSDNSSKGFPSPAYRREAIPKETRFRIVASYWHRLDWFQEGDGEIRSLVVVDDFDTKSILSFGKLALYSNRKDLSNLRDEGFFKE